MISVSCTQLKPRASESLVESVHIILFLHVVQQFRGYWPFCRFLCFHQLSDAVSTSPRARWYQYLSFCCHVRDGDQHFHMFSSENVQRICQSPVSTQGYWRPIWAFRFNRVFQHAMNTLLRCVCRQNGCIIILQAETKWKRNKWNKRSNIVKDN